MMKKYVSPEMAKLLKEKGYNRKCFAYYFPNGTELCYNITPYRGAAVVDCLYSYNSLSQECVNSELIDAPTIADVLEWLVEDKNIFVEVHAHATMATISKMAYFCYVRHGSNGADIFLAEPTTESFGRCKDAYLAGIDYAIKNLI